jgi:hypothetical protein
MARGEIRSAGLGWNLASQGNTTAIPFVLFSQEIS